MVRGRVAGLSRVAGMLVWSGAVALSGGAQAQTSVQEQIGRIEIQIAELQAQICWRRLNLDSACRYFFDRGLVANV